MFGNTAEECTPSIAGTVGYNTSQNVLELCDGSSWSSVVTGGLDQTPDKPGRLNTFKSNVLNSIFSRDVIKF